MHKHSAMNKRRMLQIRKQLEQNAEWKNCLQCFQQKYKKSVWKLKVERWWTVKRKSKQSIKLSRLKVVQYCIQLTIAKNEIVSKTAVNFLIYDSMFVSQLSTTKPKQSYF